jgi:predicted phage terminase large subunit-like protein
MERGEGSDATGSKISRHVFTGQYQQSPKALGGNLFKGADFFRFPLTPKIRYRKIYADTAQKTAERNDFSVFACYGLGVDGKLYVLDLIRGKWEAPELKRRAVDFWNKNKLPDSGHFGALRKLMVEDKSSGTGLVQEIKFTNSIPVEGIQRHKDKLTRAMDAQPYVESGMVGIPSEAPWALDLIAEAESFTTDDSHDFDDMVDTLFDAISDMLAPTNKLAQWVKLAEKGK